MKKIAAATALEVRATGIPYTFAPCIAVINFVENISKSLILWCKYLFPIIYKNQLSYRFAEIQGGVAVMKVLAKIPN